MAKTRIAVNGAAGRMGQRLVALASSDPELEVVGALERPGHPRLGQDAGLVAGVGVLGLELADKLTAPVDAVIDFSTPLGADAVIASCLAKRTPLVMATTGLEGPQQQK